MEAKETSSNRRCRGVVKASVTRLETRVGRLEEKDRLTHSDHISVQGLLSKIKALDKEFKAYHYQILDQIDEDELEWEQAVLDDNEDKIKELMDRLRQLEAEKDTKRTRASSPDHALPLQRQLVRIAAWFSTSASK